MTDNQLMLQVRDGDIDRLGLLFERHHAKLYNYFLRLTNNRAVSEDLVQDVFLRILKYRHTYRGDGKFSTWMYRIAYNARVDYFRKQKSELVSENEIEHAESDDPDPSGNAEKNQEVLLLKKALSKLSFEKREILMLSRFQNMKYKDIAALQNCEVGTIKVKVHRALKELSQIYSTLAGEKI